MQGVVCSPCEEAQRLAEWQATGAIEAVSNQAPFSCSAAASSADPFHLSQGTQPGTVLEQAAAIISYSQVHENPSPAQQQQRGNRLLPQAVLHAAHQNMRATVDVPQTSSAPVPQGMAQLVSVSKQVHDADAQQATAATAATEAAATAGVAELQVQGNGGRDQGGGTAGAAPWSVAVPTNLPSMEVQAAAAQTQTHVPSAPVLLQTDTAAQAETAAPFQSLAEAPLPSAHLAEHSTLQGTANKAGQPAKANPAELSAVSQKARAQEVCEDAAEQTDDDMPLAAEENLGDIAATEVQLPDHAPLAQAAACHQNHPAPINAFTTAAVKHVASGISKQLTLPQQQQNQQGTAGEAAACQKSAEAAEGARLAVVSEALLESQQMLLGSPTQDLRLQLTHVEPALADQCAVGAAEAFSQQPQLKPPAEQLPHQAWQAQQAQHAQQGPVADVQDDLCQAAGESPAQLDLNLDTQVPDQAAPVREPLASAPTGEQKSPEVRRGWWNQPWSVAHQPEDADSLPAGLQL